MTGCQTCGGFGMHHDPVAHGTENAEPCCDYRDHGGENPACDCPMHAQSALHPFGGFA